MAGSHAMCDLMLNNDPKEFTVLDDVHFGKEDIRSVFDLESLNWGINTNLNQ